jgi:hypothetical protein
MLMRLGLLGCAAALTLFGAAAAQAETIYVDGPGYVTTDPDYGYVATAPGYGYVATAPAYGYTAPAPFETRRYIVAEPPARVLAEPPSSYVVVERPAPIVRPPVVVERGPGVMTRPSGIVTTGYSSGSCAIDINGFERCY